MSQEKVNRYKEEKANRKELLAKGDPYYNPNFSLDRSDYSLRTGGD